LDHAIVVLAWTLGTVFVLAALGKIAAPSSPGDVVLATGEGLLGVVLVLGVYPLVASVLVAVTAAAYCAYAFLRRPDEDCSCFGRRLPRSSRRMQRARNTLLATLAFAYFVLACVGGTPSSSNLSVVVSGVGLLSGMVVVVAPWLVEWTLMM
jgi:hypothetical protein